MECSRLPRVKEEEEEEEADVSKLPPTGVLVTSDDDDEEKPPECSQLPRHLVPSGDRAGGPRPENVIAPPSHSDNLMNEADCKGDQRHHKCSEKDCAHTQGTFYLW